MGMPFLELSIKHTSVLSVICNAGGYLLGNATHLSAYVLGHERGALH